MNFLIESFHLVLAISCIIHLSRSKKGTLFEDSDSFGSGLNLSSRDELSKEDGHRDHLNAFEMLFDNSHDAWDSYLLEMDEVTRPESRFQRFILWLKYNVIQKEADRNELIMAMLRNRIYVRYALESYNRKLFLRLMGIMTSDRPKKIDWQEIWDKWMKYDGRNCHKESSESKEDSSFDSFDSHLIRLNSKDPLGILKKTMKTVQ